MADDEIERIEAVFGALSRIAAGDEPDTDLRDARCPNCGQSSFAHVADLYQEALARLGENPTDANAVHTAGLTDLQIVDRLSPPRRKSAALTVLLVALPLAALAAFAYYRLGELLGQVAIGVAIVVTVIVLMTTLRRLSDDYYDRRRRWNGLFVCRHCGQLVAS